MMVAVSDAQSFAKVTLIDLIDHLCYGLGQFLNIEYMIDNSNDLHESRLVPYLRLFNEILGDMNQYLVQELFKMVLHRLYDVILTKIINVIISPSSDRQKYYERTKLAFVLDEFTRFIHGGGAGLSPDKTNAKKKKIIRFLSALKVETSIIVEFCRNEMKVGIDISKKNEQDESWESLLLEDKIAILDARDFDSSAQSFVVQVTKVNTEVYVGRMFPSVPTEEEVLLKEDCSNIKHKSGSLFLTNNFILFHQNVFHSYEHDLSSSTKLILPLKNLSVLQLYVHWRSGSSLRFFTSQGEKYTFHLKNSEKFGRAVISQANQVHHYIIFEDITQATQSNTRKLSQQPEKISETVHKIFNLPTTEVLSEACNSTLVLKGNSSKNGLVYIFTNYFCFQPFKINQGELIICHKHQIKSIEKANTNLVQQNAIRIKLITQKEYLFSFRSHTTRYELFNRLLSWFNS
eukprot:c20943_g1_i2.p1 GENE.c20943_g1_i2~~c20943_g1_i2.p1  ORF type:complete len:460 (-),score=91.85 c20943_g1_i2:88-1467(-)